MEEIIQKLKTFYNEKGVFFDRLNEFSNEARTCYLDVNGDDSGLESYANNYKAVVEKIADELKCTTQHRFDVLDFAFDLECEEGVIKVVYENNQLDLYEIES